MSVVRPASGTGPGSAHSAPGTGTETGAAHPAPGTGTETGAAHPAPGAGTDTGAAHPARGTGTRHRGLPPGPKLPLLGALIGPGRDPLKLFTRLARDYGDIAFLRLGSERVYVVSHPQYIRDVLVTHQSNFTKSRGLERAKKLLGEGLLTSEGATHLGHRRLLQPAFHRDRIAGYAAVMVEHADRTRSRWRNAATIDVSKEMMRLTLSIVGKTLFDSDVESKADEVGVAVTEVLDTFWFTLLPFSNLIDKLPVPVLRRGRAARARLDALIYSMVDERRATGRDHGDLLSMLIAAEEEEPDDMGTVPIGVRETGGRDMGTVPSADLRGSRNTCGSPGVAASPGASAKRGQSPYPGPPEKRGLSPIEIRDEAMTILLAGHETTANALTWTFYLLSQAPEVEARLHAEIDRALGGRLPTMGDLARLPLVERVITESMRLYPPAWIVGRRAIDEYAMGDYLVPPGAMIFMSPYILHRDARFFPDPERFDPDRWTPECKASLPKFAYFPFGGGVRQCIGEPFAWMELMLVVTTIAQHWQLRLVPDHPVAVQPLITLRAKHGMAMTATHR